MIDGEQNRTLRIAGVVRESIVDGPGIRFSVFCQGCPHDCSGCHNPQTHDADGGKDYPIDKILEEVDKNPLLAGVTFSGGEPLLQAEPLSQLAEEIAQRNLDIVVFSGYTYEEILRMSEGDPAIKKLMAFTDLLIDGRFEKDKRDISLQFRGSSNQRIIDMKLSREAGHMVPAEKYMT